MNRSLHRECGDKTCRFLDRFCYVAKHNISSNALGKCLKTESYIEVNIFSYGSNLCRK